MNEFFVVQESQSDKYDFVVYSTMGENVLDHLKEIEKEISDRFDAHEKSTILFDTLLYSGNTPDRFIWADYADGAFITDSFDFASVPSNDEIRQLALTFFMKNKTYIEQSGVLNSAQKGLMLRGISI